MDRNRRSSAARPRPRAVSVTAFVGSTLLCGALLAASAQADELVPKQLYLYQQGSELIASNARRSTVDVLKLDAKEKVQDKVVANAVAVIATNQRLIAYSAYTGAWDARRLDAGEQVVSLQARDYSASVLTNQRILNYNGRNGAWAARDRPVQ